MIGAGIHHFTRKAAGEGTESQRKTEAVASQTIGSGDIKTEESLVAQFLTIFPDGTKEVEKLLENDPLSSAQLRSQATIVKALDEKFFQWITLNRWNLTEAQSLEALSSLYRLGFIRSYAAVADRMLMSMSTGDQESFRRYVSAFIRSNHPLAPEHLFRLIKELNDAIKTIEAHEPVYVLLHGKRDIEQFFRNFRASLSPTQ